MRGRAVLVDEKLCVLDKEVHVELIFGLLVFVWTNVEEDLVIIDGFAIFVDSVKRLETRVRVVSNWLLTVVR